MRHWSFILIAGFFCCYVSGGVAAQCTSPKTDRQDGTTRRESGRLRKTFGIYLPDSARVVRVLKTPQTKVTFLLVEMPPPDGPAFKKSLGGGPFPKGAMLQIAIEDADCLPQGDVTRCISIGYVNYPEDNPEDVIHAWFKARGFLNDAIAVFNSRGFKKYASMFLDSKRGLLLLWYKA